MQEPRKNATSDKGAPSIDQAVIDSVFPLTRPDWDFNTAEVSSSANKCWFQERKMQINVQGICLGAEHT